MRFKLRAWILVILLLAGCGAGADQVEGERATLEAAYGSSLDGVELEQSGSGVTLTFASLPEEGKLVRLLLDDAGRGSEEWTGAANSLHLVAPVEGGFDIGLVPIATYAGEQVVLKLNLADSSRVISEAPTGQANLIQDLTVTSVGSGEVALEWTQVNIGDYNFDGEVNISDLTPLAPRIGDSVDRSAPGAELLTEYWIDGDANGEITIADITPIGANYRNQVVGYNIRQNGTKLGEDNSPTVPAVQAEERPGLPDRFHVVVAGNVSDAWTVAPVDNELNEGASASAGGAPVNVDIRTSLSIIGLELLDLETGEAGDFGPGKFATRVIDPIDVVDRAPIGQAILDGSDIAVGNVPRDRSLMIDINYAPTVDLATGGIKQGSRARGVSAVSEEDLVTTSVLFHLAESEQPGDIDLTIEAVENPEGPGYWLDITAVLNMPGDNPATPQIENGYQETQETREYYADSEVSRDTNLNGFEDNTRVCDPDRDAVGEGLRAQYAKFDDDYFEDGDEMEIDATIVAIDLCSGEITLEAIVNEDDAARLYTDVDPNIFIFTEKTEFLERTDQFEDGIVVGPEGFAVGERVSVDMYPFTDDTGEATGYWVEKLKRDLRT